MFFLIRLLFRKKLLFVDQTEEKKNSPGRSDEKKHFFLT